ncbi:MAG: 3-phosphoserine/phosphohydroxythreonine transaminase [Saprospiraceae bacterium]|nr:3-phosphoserine/phosphohydroxythreonine transaminase [Saprospiraceae bacterium]
MKKYNFSPGPAILPKEVIEEAAQGTINLNNSGLSILEISHRSADFTAIIQEAEQLVRELLGVSDDYAVLFLSGGASTQFFMVPMNLLSENDTAAYLDTGSWASKAIKEAKLFGKVEVLASSKADNYSYIPKEFTIPANARYLHLTSNNTIYGTQYQWWPETNIPLVSDMSSDIFSRPIDIQKFGLIYAGAQKNMGPAGVTLVIVRKDLIGKSGRALPAMLDYQTHIEGESLYNTPPVFPIYVSMLTLRWVKKMGGLKAIEQHNEAKAKLLYDEIDSNPLFKGTTTTEDRSRMNVTFVMSDSELEKSFLKACEEAGCVELKGHRSVGGFRASVYNAMPMEGIQTLVNVMRDFTEKHD